MQPIKKVVVLGAAGTVGSQILAVLTAYDSPFTVTILTRPDSTADFSTVQNSSQVIHSEYIFEDLKSAFQGQDAVVSATSVFTIDKQKVILEAAKAAGVKRFILNEYANSPVYQTGLPELMVYRKVKDEVRDIAQQLSDEGGDFTWSAVATGNLIDLSLLKYPIFGFNIPQRTARLVDDGDEPITATTLRDIGIAVRGVLLNTEQTRNRFVHVRSTFATQKDILEAFEKLTEEKWTVSRVTSRDLLESGRKGFAAGDRQGMLDLLVAQLFEKGANRSVVVSPENSDNALVGVKEKEVSEIVRDVLAVSAK